MNYLAAFFCSLLLASSGLGAYTLQEKLLGQDQSIDDFSEEMSKKLKEVDDEIRQKRQALELLYREAEALALKETDLSRYKELAAEIQALRTSIHLLEEGWREKAAGNPDEELYALWDQPEVSLAQLIMDYASQNYVYLIPPEIGQRKLSINSRLPIPRASWEEMIEIILSQNGIGIRQLNPYLRELYSMREMPSGLYGITHNRQDLTLMPKEARAAFLISPKVTESERVARFLESFSQKQKVDIRLIGHKILIVSDVQEIEELLKIYDFASFHYEGQDFRLISLQRISPNDVTSILEVIFSGKAASDKDADRIAVDNKKGGALLFTASSGFRVISLQQSLQSLFLIGTKEELDRAEEIIQFIEKQAGLPTEKVVHWYVCKHSDAEELAEVLQKVYDLLKLGTSSMEKKKEATSVVNETRDKTRDWNHMSVPPLNISFGATHEKKAEKNGGNFIVDPKTGSIVMVVEADILEKMELVLKKLDVPKKMVQIEVLLFEKKITDQSDFGLNLLQIESKGNQTNHWGTDWNNTAKKGILSYTFSQAKKAGFPAFNLAYQFLISQGDVHVNACPSILTVNQTPGKISIVEEISVNSGVVLGENNKNPKDSFVRTQYGINIEITPTIHNPEEGIGQEPFITLETNIQFDTPFRGDDPAKPDVTIRSLKNQVRVRNGETIILGGLRNKDHNNSRQSIPFLGDIPGIGKLFSMTTDKETTSEMFIFLTPKVVSDVADERDRMRLEMLQKRPGDIPEFLREVMIAKEESERRAIHNSLHFMFSNDRQTAIQEEYDGR
ncbi:MAG: hypothetical protein K0S07_907 [Chlamydiales bacterium]|jgi:general secretion pathway protein D|nr:hypothetical protein [Chlamydiales bacterium]